MQRQQAGGKEGQREERGLGDYLMASKQVVVNTGKNFKTLSSLEKDSSPHPALYLCFSLTTFVNCFLPICISDTIATLLLSYCTLELLSRESPVAIILQESVDTPLLSSNLTFLWHLSQLMTPSLRTMIALSLGGSFYPSNYFFSDFLIGSLSRYAHLNVVTYGSILGSLPFALNATSLKDLIFSCAIFYVHLKPMPFAQSSLLSSRGQHHPAPADDTSRDF